MVLLEISMMIDIIDKVEIGKFQKLLNNVNRIVITCHKTADGDAIGSSLALCLLLRNMGKNATVIIPDQLPWSLNFIAQGKDYVTFSHQEIMAKNIVRNTQLLISLDYNDFNRVCAMKTCLEEAQVPKVLIDHHLNPVSQFDVKFSHPEMSSTCELIYRIIEQCGWNSFVDKDIASCIFVGIMTDTGNLAFSSSYPEVYEVMARLMERGIDKPYLYKMAMDTVPLNSLKLQSYAILNKMTVIDDKFALIVLNKDDLEKFDYKPGDTERLVNRPLSVSGIYWSTFMREDAKYIKVSMRSEGDLAVDGLCAKYYNGGGHMHAAAGEHYGTLQEAIEIYYKIVEEIKKTKFNN